MKNRFYISVFCASSCFLFACVKQVTKIPQAETAPSVQQSSMPLDYIKKVKKDTLTYIMGFHDTLERGFFATALEKLIKEFPSKASEDSTKELFIKTQTFITPLSASESVHVQPSMVFPPPKPEMGVEKPVHYGGSAAIYTPRGAYDPALAALVEAFLCGTEACPAKGQNSSPPFCAIRLLSDKKVSLTISTIAKSASGKPFSAFDVVTLWSNHVKQHPAEGRALFRYVNGIDQFIAGREAVVPGFQVSDEKTVILQLSQADPWAVQRLCTSGLFPASFKAGPYVVKDTKSNTIQLAPNEHYRFGKPFLGSCEIRYGQDNNPFLSFSLNRYDVMELYSIKDMDYARRGFSDKASLRFFSENRYFLSLALGSVDLRGTLCRLFDRKDMLANYVKAEGSVLLSLETQENNAEAAAITASPALTSIPSGLTAAPIVILSQNDDPISVIIADKLLADISRVGISCTVKCVSQEEYEKTLVKREYGIAVGCVPGSVLTDQSERLRVSTMWFNDEMSEPARIDAKFEYPLFSIKTYLLCKNKIDFLNDAIEGIYLKE
jgi:hypothetical protein